MMTEGVSDLAIAIAPEHIRDWHTNLSTRFHGSSENGIGILHIQIEIGRRNILRRSDGHSGEFVAHENDGIADLKLSVVDAPIGPRHSKPLYGAKRGFVKIDCPRSV